MTPQLLDDQGLCKTICSHPDTIRKVKKNLPAEKELQAMAELFKILGDPTRIRIVIALSVAELCVCDLSGVVGASQSAVSHQLRVLRQARVVKFRREGKNAMYSLDDTHVENLLAQTLAHVRHS